MNEKLGEYKMEMVIPSTCYQFDAVAKQITLSTPYHGTTIEQIKYIRNITKQQDIYISSTGKPPLASVVPPVITFTYSGAMDDTDDLMIIIDDVATPLNVNVVDTSGLSPTAAPLITSSLVFAAGDMLTTEKLTAALTMASLSSSGNYIISVTKPVEDTAGDLTLKLYNQVKTDGINSTDQRVTTLTVEKISGMATNISFVVSGLGIGNGTIKVGGFFAADSGAITVNFTVHAV